MGISYNLQNHVHMFVSKGYVHVNNCYCAIFRPGRTSSSASGRGVLSMQGLSHGVVRVDTENSLTSLTLQDCGQVLPGGKIQFRCRLRPRNYGVHT